MPPSLASAPVAQDEAPRSGLIPDGGREFCLTSSSGPETVEVVEMKEALSKNSPILLYELLQGMVDYGRGHEPAPRVWIEYQSGRKVVFNGSVEFPPDDPIAAIEFVNGGQGMSPEDTVIYRSSGGTDTKLGGYGRGLTTALTVLAERGVKTTVQSHVDGRVWQGSCSLADSETGVTKLLQVDGRFLDRKISSRVTVIRLENPPPLIGQCLDTVGQHFLYANGRFPDVCLVEPEEGERQAVEKISVRKGEVMAVDSIVDYSPGACKFIFIDGLRIPLDGNTVVPWSVNGFSTEAEHSTYRVARNHTSNHCDEYRAAEVLLQAVAQSKDRRILEMIIEKALANPETEYLEIQRSLHFWGSASKQTAQIVQDIWKERYEGALIDDDPEWVSTFQGNGDGIKVRALPASLFHFLKTLGVPTLSSSDFAQGASRKKFNLGRLHVPSASAPDALEKLMARVARHGGDVEIVELEGKKHLQIHLDGVVTEEEVLQGKTEDDIGVMVRFIAVLAQANKIEPLLFSVEGESLYQLLVTVTADPYTADQFSVKGSIDKRRRSHFPNFRHCLSGSTYILLSGEQIEGLENASKTETLLTKFLAALKEIRMRLAGSKRVRWKSPRSRPTAAAVQEHLQDTQNLPAAFVRKKESHISAAGDDMPEMGMSTPHLEDNPEHQQLLPHGYYKRNVGSAFVHNPATKTADMFSEQRWIFQEIPVRRPKRFASRHVLKDFHGDRTIVVPEGMKISGFVANADADIEFYREARTGLYSLRGKAALCTYYTEVDHDAPYDYIPPLQAETENPVNVARLHSHWREFLDEMRVNPGLTTKAKLRLTQDAWIHYQPSQSPEEKITGDNREQVAAQILNGAQSGNLSVSAFALLLRSVGIPSRICSGFLQKSGQPDVPHQWVEYWNNIKWQRVEVSQFEESRSIARESNVPIRLPRMRLLAALATAGLLAGGAVLAARYLPQSVASAASTDGSTLTDETISSPQGGFMRRIQEVICPPEK